MTAARILAAAAAALRYDHLPPPVVQQARDLVVDTVAAIAAGVAAPEYRAFAKAQGGERGACSIPGMAEGVPFATAVAVNSGATTVLQIQDGHRVARGHPASQIVPLLLAQAETGTLSGPALIAGLVAGYECGVRIGVALGGLQDALHDAGNWSAVGGTVALLHGSADAAMIEAGIEGSAATTIFPWSRTVIAGVPTHHLYMALGAEVALRSAQGARAGWHALPGALERFLLPRAGARPDSHQLTADIDADGFTRFWILDGYLKRHPVCAHWSTTADAVADLVAAHGPLHDRVTAADVAIYGYAMHYNVDAPATALAARFSGKAVVAALLEDGLLGDESLSDARRASPDFQARMARITVRHDPVLDGGYPAGRPVRVTLTLDDGTQLVHEATVPRGDAGSPLDVGERRDKALALLGVPYGSGNAAVLAAIHTFLDGGPIGPLSASLRRSRLG